MLTFPLHLKFDVGACVRSPRREPVAKGMLGQLHSNRFMKLCGAEEISFSYVKSNTDTSMRTMYGISKFVERKSAPIIYMSGSILVDFEEYSSSKRMATLGAGEFNSLHAADGYSSDTILFLRACISSGTHLLTGPKVARAGISGPNPIESSLSGLSTTVKSCLFEPATLA